MHGQVFCVSGLLLLLFFGSYSSVVFLIQNLNPLSKIHSSIMHYEPEKTPGLPQTPLSPTVSQVGLCSEQAEQIRAVLIDELQHSQSSAKAQGQFQSLREISPAIKMGELEKGSAHISFLYVFMQNINNALRL